MNLIFNVKYLKDLDCLRLFVYVPCFEVSGWWFFRFVDTCIGGIIDHHCFYSNFIFINSLSIISFMKD